MENFTTLQRVLIHLCTDLDCATEDELFDYAQSKFSKLIVREDMESLMFQMELGLAATRDFERLCKKATPAYLGDPALSKIGEQMSKISFTPMKEEQAKSRLDRPHVIPPILHHISATPKLRTKKKGG